MKESLFESTMRRTKEIIQKNGSIRSLAEKLETNPSTITRWFAEEGRAPRFDALAKIFEFFSVDIVFPGENQKRHSAEKERDALKAQVEVLKDIIRPAQLTLNEESKEKSA